MLFEIAMTPDIFDASIHSDDKSLGVVLVQLLRGIAENGLLANLNKGNWIRHVTENRTVTLDPHLKDKVNTCLKILADRNRLVKRPKTAAGNPKDDLDWLEATLECHRRASFHAVIISQILVDLYGPNDVFVTFTEETLNSARWLEMQGRRSLRLRKTPDDFRAALGNILRHARSITLIDPYLSRKTRYLDTVRICSELLGQGCGEPIRKPGRIHLHAEAKKQEPCGKDPDSHLDSWEEVLRPLVSKHGHRFTVFLWDRFPERETLHDRYIITEQCGFDVPGGLDCRKHSVANKTNLTLMDEEVRRDVILECQIPTATFSIVAKREVCR